MLACRAPGPHRAEDEEEEEAAAPPVAIPRLEEAARVPDWAVAAWAEAEDEDALYERVYEERIDAGDSDEDACAAAEAAVKARLG